MAVLKGETFMQFVVVTVYDQKAVSAMAKALRKTLREKQSRRSHVLGWLIVVLSVLVLAAGTVLFVKYGKSLNNHEKSDISH